MLTLQIKKKWFDMIASGEKKEEYREIKEYYNTRFMNTFGFIEIRGKMYHGEDIPEEIRREWPVPVRLRNGYSVDAPEITVMCNLRIGTGKTEWGALPGHIYYVLEIVEAVKDE